MNKGETMEEKYVYLQMSIQKDGFTVQFSKEFNADAPDHGDQLYGAIMAALSKVGYSLQINEPAAAEPAKKRGKK